MFLSHEVEAWQVQVVVVVVVVVVVHGPFRGAL